MKKLLLIALGLAAVGGLLFAVYSMGQSNADVDNTSVIQEAKAAGVAEGRSLGYKAAIDSGDRWMCIHAETPSDGGQVLFCTNNKSNRDVMCAQAKANAASDPALVILGCPDGTFIADRVVQ